MDTAVYWHNVGKSYDHHDIMVGIIALHILHFVSTILTNSDHAQIAYYSFIQSWSYFHIMLVKTITVLLHTNLEFDHFP